MEAEARDLSNYSTLDDVGDEIITDHKKEVERYDEFNQLGIDENTRVKIKLNINLQFKINRVNIQKLDDDEIEKKRVDYTNVMITRYLKDENYEGIKQLYETHTLHQGIAVEILKTEMENLKAAGLPFAGDGEYWIKFGQVITLYGLFLIRK